MKRHWQWTRRLRLRDQGQSIGGQILFRSMQFLRAKGELNSAYRVALVAERLAILRGEQEQALVAILAVREMSPHVVYSTSSLIESLEHGTRLAVASELWRDALKHVETILALEPSDVRLRGRALRNRATFLTTLGRFEEAISSYDILQKDDAVWSKMSRAYQVGFNSSRAICEWYRGKVDIGSLAGMTPHLAGAPATWQNYWWVLAHIAWRDRPDRLASVRRSSFRTFDPAWPREVDRVLWGIDLLAADEPNGLVMERRLKSALNNPETIVHLGRSSWLDLYSDWLEFYWRREPERAAALTREHTLWCELHGYDGWAQYWQTQRMARVT